MVRIAKRRRLGVARVHVLADIRVAKHTQPFGIGGHDAVFDAIVDHLDEMPCAIGTAVQVTEFSRAANLLAAGRARDITATGCQRGEDRIEMLHDRLIAADHHAVAALESPDAAAGADVDVLNSALLIRSPGGYHRRNTNSRHR